LVEKDFGDSVRGGTGKLTLPVIIQQTLKIGPSRGTAVERAITLPQIKIGARSTGNTWILTKVFFIFRDRQVIELPGKKPVGVIELAPVGLFSLSRWRFGRRLLRI
jgi:hypothetical protein